MTANASQPVDAIFRFALGHEQQPATLTDLYRDQLRDLLQILRFYSQGTPVIIDGFAFQNAPSEIFDLLPPKNSDPVEQGSAQ